MSNTPTPTFPCPSCGFVVFDEPAGSYDICPICGWEDDHVQLGNPLLRGGANGGSLLEYQQEILKKIPAEICEHNGHKRYPNWRPLTGEDCKPKTDSPKSGLEYFQAAIQDASRYYWDKTGEQGAG
jgi:hypothetical protein